MKGPTVIEWKWTTGENVERSKRMVGTNAMNGPINGINAMNGPTNAMKVTENGSEHYDEYQKQVEKFAYDASLHHDENSWELYNNTTQVNTTSLQQPMDTMSISKREDTDKRMAERQMFSQKGLNPYLTNNDYVNDIVISNNFLKPVSTTTEKEM
jgi:hypothetical protein